MSPPRLLAARPTFVARLIGPWLSERLGQQFVIDNRPGGGTNIGTEAVVRAPADGYTLLMVGGYNAINATLYDKLIIRLPLVMVVNPSVPAKTVPELTARLPDDVSPFKCELTLDKKTGPRAHSAGTV